MVLAKIVLAGVAVVCVLVLAQQQNWFERAGITGHCTAAATPPGGTGQWWSCREGKLTGYPVLPEDKCDTNGYVGNSQIWRCTTPIADAPGY
jgi:hypothetical protein